MKPAKTHAGLPDRTFSNSNRMLELDGLRGFAVLCVIFSHYVSYGDHSLTVTNYLVRATGLFSFWVDLFLVLSAFLLGGILLENKNSKNYFKVFFVRRILRIIPLYAALLLSFAFFLVLEREKLLIIPPKILQSAYSIKCFFVFIQNFMVPITGRVEPHFLSLTWSVALEEQFYLALPWVILFCPRPALKRLLVLSFFSALFFRCIVMFFNPFHFPDPYWGAYMLPFCKMDTFCVGIMLAILVKNPFWFNLVKKNIGFFYATLIFFVGVFICMTWKKPFLPKEFISTIGYSVFSVTAGLIVLITLAHSSGLGRFCRSPFLLGWGKISYFAYLFHVPFLALFHGVLTKNKEILISDWKSLTIALGSLAALWFAGQLSWNFFEKKFVRLGHKLAY